MTNVFAAGLQHGTIRAEVRGTGGLLGPRVEKLYIAGREQTELLPGLTKQVDAVTVELADVGRGSRSEALCAASAPSCPGCPRRSLVSLWWIVAG